ncbi:MAG: nitroreductase family protein [Burkholderiaceae bacterium]|jgi:ferredoxin|nr:nitroreductase family protein [Burkholderiaceae bacterium]
MGLIALDYGKCSKCGLCVRVCPYVVLEMDPANGPRVVRDKCIACGHCVAVCPRAALDNNKAPRKNQPADTGTPFSEADSAWYLRARRTVRWYQKKPVARGKITRWLDIARFAPTASNTQGIVWLIIDNPLTIQSVARAVIAWEQSEVANNPNPFPIFEAQLDRYGRGEDSILFGAPCLIVALSVYSSQKRARENAVLSMMYAQLHAPSLGLGTCWAGVLEACVGAGWQPLLDVLNLPPDHTFCGAMVVGYPNYRYHNLTDREPLALIWAEPVTMPLSPEEKQS